MVFLPEKESLLKEIEAMGVRDKEVLGAVWKTPREMFVPKRLLDLSYKNHPLPIGCGQTISQPFTVAFMVELLEIKESSKILEIGAGSGYNAAVMSKLTKSMIYSVELEKDLCGFAMTNLRNAKIENVKIVGGDGKEGYRKESPYDRIIVTAGAEEIPEELIIQLSENGILVIPIITGFNETMVKVRKRGKHLEKSFHGQFTFVPLR